MRIPIVELKEKISRYLLSGGLNTADAGTLAELVVDRELLGNQFSPLGELPDKLEKISETANVTVDVAVDKPSLKLIKGNGRFAPLITADYLDEIVVSAMRQGIYAFGIYDSTYNEFFDIFCRRIAARDCIAIIVENGGPQGVVPFGGKKDVLGTNPLAYGIPTHGYPIVFDGATAMHAYGRIRQAKEQHERLPENAYLDKDGNVTTDPEDAVSIMPFGGFKGYAINLLADVLSGSLVRGRSGLDQPIDSERYIGTCIIVIDPASFGDIEEFKNSTSKLASDLLAVPAANPDQPVRVPGFRGAKRRERLEAEGVVELDDKVWRKFSEAIDSQKSITSE